MYLNGVVTICWTKLHFHSKSMTINFFITYIQLQLEKNFNFFKNNNISIETICFRTHHNPSHFCLKIIMQWKAVIYIFWQYYNFFFIQTHFLLVQKPFFSSWKSNFVHFCFSMNSFLMKCLMKPAAMKMCTFVRPGLLSTVYLKGKQMEKLYIYIYIYILLWIELTFS